MQQSTPLLNQAAESSNNKTIFQQPVQTVLHLLSSVNKENLQLLRDHLKDKTGLANGWVEGWDTIWVIISIQLLKLNLDGN